MHRPRPHRHRGGLDDGLITPVLRDCDAKSLGPDRRGGAGSGRARRGRASSARRRCPARRSPSRTSACSTSTSSRPSSIPPEGAILAVGAVRREARSSWTASSAWARRMKRDAVLRPPRDGRRHGRPLPARTSSDSSRSRLRAPGLIAGSAMAERRSTSSSSGRARAATSRRSAARSSAAASPSSRTTGRAASA